MLLLKVDVLLTYLLKTETVNAGDSVIQMAGRRRTVIQTAIGADVIGFPMIFAGLAGVGQTDRMASGVTICLDCRGTSVVR